MPTAATCRSPKSGFFQSIAPDRRGQERRDAGIGRDARAASGRRSCRRSSEFRIAHGIAAAGLAVLGAKPLQVLLETPSHPSWLTARPSPCRRPGRRQARRRQVGNSIAATSDIGEGDAQKTFLRRTEIRAGQTEHAALARRAARRPRHRFCRRRDARHRRSRRRSSRSTSRRARRSPLGTPLRGGRSRRGCRRAIRRARRSPRAAQAAALAARRSAACRGSSRSPRRRLRRRRSRRRDDPECSRISRSCRAG